MSENFDKPAKHLYIFCMHIITKSVKTTLIAATLLLAACAQQPPEVCQEIDWYELGRQDGTRGFDTNKRREVAVQCESSDPSLSEALYHNGFDSGVSQFCLPENGFQLGQDNRPVQPDICPPMMREEFLQSYTNGQNAKNLKAQKKTLDARLLNLEGALKDPNVDRLRRGILKGEKLEIQAKQKEIEKALRSARK
jgi:hypothetical protein